MGEAAFDHGYSTEKLHPFPVLNGGGPPKVPPKTPKKRRSPSNPPTSVVSEDAAALAFAVRHQNELLYCHDTGAWFEWKGAAWIKNGTGLAHHYARLLARDMASSESEKIQAVVGRAGFASGVETLSRRDPIFARQADIWDADPWLLGTPGGTVDLRSGLLRPARPSEHITRLTAVAPVNEVDCPVWLHFLQEATGGDAQYIRFIQQWGGYCLTGDTREQALCFAYGNGGNGKGVLIRVLSGILADYAMTAQMETFTASKYDRHPTEIASLRGCRLVTASETEHGRQWAESRIKQLTGGDTMRARHMRKDEFEFVPVLKLLLIGNDQPTLSSVDDAARRRFNLLPFEFTPATADLRLEEKLRAEWPSILRWLIDGCLDWQANGLIRPAVVTGATAEYFSEQDVVGRWLDERCIVEKGNKWRRASTAELFASWSEYARASSEPVGTERAFTQVLLKRKFAQNKNVVTATGARVRGFEGVELRREQSAEQADD